jgi:tetratricopeptide (TPR) repeat protein
MRKNFAVLVLVVLVMGLCASPVFGQATGSVKGVCKDANGALITGAIVDWTSPETGRKYTVKTNAKGEYFSLGVSPGKYNVKLIKDGQELWHVNNVTVGLDEVDLDFDLKKEQMQAVQGQGMSAEEAKAKMEQAAKAQKENMTVKQLNEHLAASNEAVQAGNYDQAITILAEATQMDATRDLLWFKLGDAYRMSAPKQTDQVEKKKRYDEAVQDYQKAVDIKQAEQNPKDPVQAKKTLAAYYNNLADALAKTGKLDDAVKAYDAAAQADPTSAGQYAFNAGAILTNAGKADEAISQFDKAIAADPNKADAYFQKGVNLMAKATLTKDGKTEPAPGTVESFQKYLELAPTGPNAQTAKDILASLGTSVETSYSKKKSATKK